MLALKTLTAAARHGLPDGASRPPGAAAPGLIFDEVDAGIGGRVADVVGRKLRALGSAFQVLCITHLPQIAASADAHFQIEKRVEGGRTVTSITRLDGPARVDEIGRMLGGELTPSLRATATHMIEKKGRVNSSEGRAKGESERRKSKGESPQGSKGDNGKGKRIGS
jgi:DNA repair protein RecN (Recombination protein N)